MDPKSIEINYNSHKNAWPPKSHHLLPQHLVSKTQMQMQIQYGNGTKQPPLSGGA